MHICSTLSSNKLDDSVGFLHMSAYIRDRRDFLKLTAASSLLPLLPSVAWAKAMAYDRTSWYRNAKFGMFIHWGPYSQASVEASWPILTPKPGGANDAQISPRRPPIPFDIRNSSFRTSDARACAICVMHQRAYHRSLKVEFLWGM